MDISRRNFISIASKLSIVITAFYFMRRNSLKEFKTVDNDELVIVNGWVLKKSDLT